MILQNHTFGGMEKKVNLRGSREGTRRYLSREFGGIKKG
jgi:hypothetical protein